MCIASYFEFLCHFDGLPVENLNFFRLPQLLGDILLDRSNSAVMVRYVSSKDNLRILMNLLRVSILPSMKDQYINGGILHLISCAEAYVNINFNCTEYWMNIHMLLV